MPPRPTALAAIAAVAVALSACSTRPDRAPGQPPAPAVRSMTGAVPAPAPADGFSFLVGGHLYGNPGTLSAIPSTTLIARLLPLRESEEQFIVSTGDIVRACNPVMVTPTLEALHFLEKPTFNAPGNHDYREGDYEQYFGPSFGAFRYGNAMFVILNTERDPWHLEPAQLDMIRTTGDWVLQQPDIDHVFYFAHKLVFAVDEPRYEAVLRNCNGRDGFDGTSNFKREVLPTVQAVAKQKHVLWFGGDFGVSWGYSLFYDEHPELGVTFLGSGLGSTRRDCMLRVRIAGADCNVEAIPMPEGALLPIGEPVSGDLKRYGPEHWRRHFEKK